MFTVTTTDHFIVLKYVEIDKVPKVSDTWSISCLGIGSFKLSDRETFTEEEEAEIERATMTDAEKVAALCDLFGKYGNVASPEGKRARRDLDDGSIQFLINQMKMELDLIPSTRKTALSKALKNCSLSEFCVRDWSVSCDARAWIQRYVTADIFIFHSKN